MSVGTASIKRAADKAGTKKSAEAEVKEIVAAGTEQQPAAKATVATKKQSVAKVTASAIPAVSPEVAEQMKLTTNRVCHLTEELPVYLL